MIPGSAHLVLHLTSPGKGVARFYSLMIRRDLFGRVALVRNWDCIGINERELVEEFACEMEAGQALEAVVQVNRRRGYWGLLESVRQAELLRESRELRPVPRYLTSTRKQDHRGQGG